MELSDKEQRLIERLRKVAFGEVTIFMKDKQPYRIVITKESEIL